MYIHFAKFLENLQKKKKKKKCEEFFDNTRVIIVRNLWEILKKLAALFENLKKSLKVEKKTMLLYTIILKKCQM